VHRQRLQLIVQTRPSPSHRRHVRFTAATGTAPTGEHQNGTDGTQQPDAGRGQQQPGGPGGPELGDRLAGAVRHGAEAGRQEAAPVAAAHAPASQVVLQPSVHRVQVAVHIAQSRELGRLGVRPYGRGTVVPGSDALARAQLARLVAANVRRRRGQATAATATARQAAQLRRVQRHRRAGTAAAGMGTGSDSRRTDLLFEVSTVFPQCSQCPPHHHHRPQQTPPNHPLPRVPRSSDDGHRTIPVFTVPV